MKNLPEMTDIGFKRTMTRIQKTDELINDVTKKLRCKPEEVLDRIETLIRDIEDRKKEMQKLNDSL